MGAQMLHDDDQDGFGPTTDQLVDGLVKTLRPRLFPTAIPGLDDATMRQIVNKATLLKLGSPRVSLDEIRSMIERALPDVTGRDPGPVNEVMARIQEYAEASPWPDGSG
jgi:hypothetical protein